MPKPVACPLQPPRPLGLKGGHLLRASDPRTFGISGRCERLEACTGSAGPRPGRRRFPRRLASALLRPLAPRVGRRSCCSRTRRRRSRPRAAATACEPCGATVLRLFSKAGVCRVVPTGRQEPTAARLYKGSSATSADQTTPASFRCGLVVMNVPGRGRAANLPVRAHRRFTTLAERPVGQGGSGARSTAGEI
jgi:hypothetical protein